MGLLPWSVWVNYSLLQRQDLPNTKCPWITCFYMLSVEGALWQTVSATSSFPASGSFLTHVPWSVLSCILEGTCRPVGFSPCRAALFCLVACAVNSGLPWSPCAVSQGRPLCSATLHSLCTPAQGLPSGQAQGSSFVFQSSGSLPSVLWGLTLENCLFSP